MTRSMVHACDLRHDAVRQGPVNVAIIGRSTIVREGITRFLSDYGFRISQSVNSFPDLKATANESCENGGPCSSITLVDNQFDADDLDYLKHEFPLTRIVILTDEFDFSVMVRVFRAGVHAYVAKDISCERLIGVLHLVAIGEKFLPSQLLDEIPSHVIGHTDPQIHDLAHAHLLQREIEILRCLIMGYPNKLVSRQLDIDEVTVKVHVKAVLRKLRVKNRTQAAIWAVQRGLRAFDVIDGVPAVSVPEPSPTGMPHQGLSAPTWMIA